ncbi:heavy metal-binding domain-containing protein [Clostridium sp.]|uniref:heavy metal-binding domain-containing protein n=1 Tax=Clostridium sp. TaxID=1506 RepID=UPI002FCBEE00
MVLTTGSTIEGRKITEYKGIVFGEVVTGVNFVKDIAAGLRDIFGGRSSAYEEELVTAREGALDEIKRRAAMVGANAIVGIKIDYETLGQSGMLMVTASGTAVYID